MPKKSSSSIPLLLYAAPDTSADLLYFGRFFAPDPFIAFGHEQKRYAVLSPLEIARGRKESCFDEILSLEEWKERAKKLSLEKVSGMARIIISLAREFQIGEFRVAHDFSLGLARQLELGGLRLQVAEGSLFSEREQKDAEEAKAIQEGNDCSAAGIQAAERALRRSIVKRGKLFFENRYLTSERLKELIEIACLRSGGVSSHTIAAGGDQACDPHCSGSGVLRADELIIVDVFPRMTKSGYFGDMTRTFLKGKATEAQKRLIETVRTAHKEALERVKAGVGGSTVHRSVTRFFEDAGYGTKMDGNRPEGFFHGTGHGLGLEIHEAPRLSLAGPRLKSGQVVTVEPGLYYPGVGGARIEDVVWVKRNGVELLSRYHYRWLIR
jgi:Xaa-Pro aminopeptidase